MGQECANKERPMWSRIRVGDVVAGDGEVRIRSCTAWYAFIKRAFILSAVEIQWKV